MAYLLSQSVILLIVGRLSDVFGRRWFFIICSLIGIVSSIPGATAENINQLIGSEVLISVSSGFQISFFWVVAELVPMKWRYLANSGLYAFTIRRTLWHPRSGSRSRHRLQSSGEVASTS
jgi:MFS family permease